MLRRFGSTDLLVHPLCLGTNVFGWTLDREGAFAVLDSYAAAGGNFLDTADAYSKWVPGNRGGESERVIGEWLASRGRDGTIVATKVGSGAEELERGLRREQVIAGCEASLRRLGIDTIDLFYAHRDDPDTPVEETLAAFGELVDAGKVRYIAASNFAAPRLREALAATAGDGRPGYVGFQPRFNLVDRDRDDDFTPELRAICAEAGLGVAVYSALASGFLSGKYRRDRPPPEGGRAEAVERRYVEDERAMRVLETATRIASERGIPVAQVALAWALAQPPVTCVIASATSPAQLDQLLPATELELGAAELDALTDAG